jgi:uncharacterized membrane protein YbaN (DUF454 family)
MMSETVAENVPTKVPSVARWLYALAGVLCVGLGALGAVVPGLPTTVFLIAASYLFTRSCPVLERVLVRNRFFAPFHGYLEGSAVMPRRAKIVTLLIMWASVSTSEVLLATGGRVPAWVLPLPVLAAAVGTWFILRIGRKSRTS